DATPTIRLDTTSGTTVIRIALTNSVPNGSTRLTIVRDRAGSTRLSAIPAAIPAPSATSTRVDSDTRGRYRVRLGATNGPSSTRPSRDYRHRNPRRPGRERRQPLAAKDPTTIQLRVTYLV